MGAQASPCVAEGPTPCFSWVDKETADLREMGWRKCPVEQTRPCPGLSFIRSTVCPALRNQAEAPTSMESHRGRRGGPEGRGLCRCQHQELPVQRLWGPTQLVSVWDGEDAGEQAG